jgi:glycogen synthase
MNRPLRILIATDSFPPVCGGSGWSTWELARGLVARGHDVRVVTVSAGGKAGVAEDVYAAMPVTTYQVRAPQVPFVRNMVKNERLWRQFGRWLQADLRRNPADVIHAQHVMTTVPSIRAGRTVGIPVVATVRDYWPVCYWCDLIYDPSQPQLCPGCSARMMTRCLKPRAGAATLAAWAFIPYMRMNLAAKRTTLADASAVIAVSTAIARDLAERAPELRRTVLHTIPNPIDMSALDAAAASTEPAPMAGPYVLYAGKIATNKGTQFLARAVADAGIDWPVVVVGDGPGRAGLEADARTRRVSLHVTGWLDRTAVWSWMRHAALLAFPSYGPESLSRVLIEAAALGLPIAAMNTGGTTDILRDGVTGLVADDVAGFTAALAALAGDPARRTALGAAARAEVRLRFAAPAVVERVDEVYRSVVGARST